MEHLLFEHSGGYALFELKEYEGMSKSSYDDYMGLAQVLNFKSGMEFDSLSAALDHLQHLSRGEIHEDLKNFLEFSNVQVLHCDSSLKKSLEAIGIRQKTSDNIMRGVRKEASKLIKVGEYNDGQMILGLAYAYSRDKVEYNIKREDCIVIHTVLLLEQVDKDINSYSMRIREIYGWSFPELSSMLKDNDEYVEVVKYLMRKEYQVCEGPEDRDTECGISSEKVKKIEEAKSSSMGIRLSELDVINLNRLIDIVNEKISVKRNLTEYLKEKMCNIAPNLAAILGDVLAAKLISQAGGLFNLGKAPASTVQLLGAEKSLFRSLKTRSNTPKYGLLYTSKCLSKVRDRDKGRISRYVATKCSIATKIDCFSEDRTPAYGLELKSLIEKKVRSLHTKEEVERTETAVQRVFEKIRSIGECDEVSEGGNESSSGPKKEKKLTDGKENFKAKDRHRLEDCGDKEAKPRKNDKSFPKDELLVNASKKSSKKDRDNASRSKRRQEKKSVADEEVFRFDERHSKSKKGSEAGVSTGSKRVSFDLTRNDVKETETTPKRFKSNKRKF